MYCQYKNKRYNIDFLVAVLISIPVILKALGVIHWSWALVTLPIWGPLFAIGLFIILFIIYDTIFNLK